MNEITARMERETLLPLREEVDAKRPEVGFDTVSESPPRTRLKVLAQARKLRNIATSSERKLWRLLRGKQVSGLKFRRQAAIGPYIADFACFWPRLIVEVDGGIHRLEFYDHERAARREAWLGSQGFVVLRFSDSRVEDEPQAVIDTILKAANRRARRDPTSGPPGHLLPQGEEVG